MSSGKQRQKRAAPQAQDAMEDSSSSSSSGSDEEDEAMRLDNVMEEEGVQEVV